MGRNKFIAEEVKELKFAIKKNPSKKTDGKTSKL